MLRTVSLALLGLSLLLLAIDAPAATFRELWFLAEILLATVASSLWAPQMPQGAEEPRDDARGAIPLALVLAASGCFALGHRQGQEKAARDAATWLRLDG